jgi:hypothetical protein
MKSQDWHPADDDALGNAFAYVVTKDPAYAARALRWLRAVIPKRYFENQDYTRWAGERAIVIFDWCFDRLTDADKRAMIPYFTARISAWAKDPWGRPGVGHEDGNYYWGYLRNDLEWAFAVHEEARADAERLLADGLGARWERSFLPWAQKNEKGGVPTEGSAYGRYQQQYPLIPFMSIELGGRHIFDETDYFKGLVFYQIYATTPAPSARGAKEVAREIYPYYDDQDWLDGKTAQSVDAGDFMTTMASLWRTRKIGAYARAWLAEVKPEVSPHVAAVDEGGPAGDLTELPLDYYAPGPSFFYVRDRSGAEAETALFQLGFPNNKGHQHFDAGSFQLWRKGRWLSRETVGYDERIRGWGRGAPTSVGDTVAHNGVLFAGLGNTDGDGRPKVLRLESRADYAYAAVDLSAGYLFRNRDNPERNNPFAQSVVRELVFVRAQGALVILDRLESSSESTTMRGWPGEKRAAADVPKTFLAHFEQDARPVIDRPGHAVSRNGDQVLTVTTLVPAQPTMRVVDERLAPGDRNGQERLEVETQGSARSYLLHVLAAHDASSPELGAKVREDATSFTVTLSHPSQGEATIVFAKGMTSAGGSITVASSRCGTQRLTDRVQTIQATDDGPIWGP